MLMPACIVGDERVLLVTRAAASYGVRLHFTGSCGRWHQVVGEEQKVSHAELAKDLEKLCSGATTSGELEVCYSPIIQSGGKYDLGESAQSNYGDYLHSGVCSLMSRTHVTDPSPCLKVGLGVGSSSFDCESTTT